MKEQLENYLKEQIKDPSLSWEIEDTDGEVCRLTLKSETGFCLSWGLLDRVHNIFPYRAVVCDGINFKFV